VQLGSESLKLLQQSSGEKHRVITHPNHLISVGHDSSITLTFKYNVSNAKTQQNAHYVNSGPDNYTYVANKDADIQVNIHCYDSNKIYLGDTNNTP
jgi:hypothetical protein